MKLNELFESDDFGQPSMKTTNDKLAQLKIDDTRKPKITLKKLNSLRKLREFKKFEDLKRQSLVSIMYGGGGDTGPSF